MLSYLLATCCTVIYVLYHLLQEKNRQLGKQRDQLAAKDQMIANKDRQLGKQRDQLAEQGKRISEQALQLTEQFTKLTIMELQLTPNLDDSTIPDSLSNAHLVRLEPVVNTSLSACKIDMEKFEQVTKQNNICSWVVGLYKSYKLDTGLTHLAGIIDEAKKKSAEKHISSPCSIKTWYISLPGGVRVKDLTIDIIVKELTKLKVLTSI